MDRPSDPPGHLALLQRWEDLLFAHWELPTDAVARRLPRGLEPDTFGGRSHAGVVAFAMRRVRPRGWPALPWISNFLELNVRLYVRGPGGRPGVFFLSLDCDRWPAVAIARARYHLPYFHADLQRGSRSVGRTFHCRRQGEALSAEFAWESEGPARVAETGTLEQFLAERYTFFTEGPRGLMAGEVRHAPYAVTPARLATWSDLPLRWDGLPGLGEPCHAMVSPGVDVRCWSLVDADLPPGAGAL
jgi:uncharacterized protein